MSMPADRQRCYRARQRHGQIIVDCNGCSVADVMQEATARLDAHIGETLKNDERSLWCRGCPPHELAKIMHEHRGHIHALRDAFLERQRTELTEWFAEEP